MQLNEKTRDLVSKGSRFTAPLLRWERGLSAESAARKIEHGKPVDLWVDDSRTPITDQGDLAELHVFLGSGSPESLSDPALAKSLKAGAGKQLQIARADNPDQELQGAFPLYNLLTGQWEGRVTSFQSKVDREDILAEGYFRYGAIERDELSNPERAVSMEKLASSPYKLKAFPSLEAVYHADNIRFTNGPSNLPAAVLDDPSRLESILGKLDRIRQLEAELFSLKPEEVRADTVLMKEIWKNPDFNLEACSSTMKRCAEMDKGRQHFHRLIANGKLPTDKQVDQYFKIVEVCGSEPVPASSLAWLTHSDKDFESRLPLMASSRELLGDKATHRELGAVAAKLEASETPGDAIQTMKELIGAGRSLPLDLVDFVDSLSPELRQTFLEVRGSAQKRKQHLPYLKLFSEAQEQGEPWLSRFQALRSAGVDPAPAVYAALELRGEKPSEEDLKLAGQLAPWENFETYRQALGYASELSPEGKEAFVETYAGWCLNAWDSIPDKLFPDGKPDKKALEVLKLLRKEHGLGAERRLRKAMDEGVPLNLLKKYLTESDHQKAARRQRWSEYFTLELSNRQMNYESARSSLESSRHKAERVADQNAKWYVPYKVEMRENELAQQRVHMAGDSLARSYQHYETIQKKFEELHRGAIPWGEPPNLK